MGGGGGRHSAKHAAEAREAKGRTLPLLVLALRHLLLLELLIALAVVCGFWVRGGSGVKGG